MSTTTKKFPITEIFGPTIQGEGIDQGLPVYFIRFGGCDFRCEWCDTPHAVLPHLVRQSERMTEDEIIDALSRLTIGPEMVVLSGGNPALHELFDLCRRLKSIGLRVAVETQGTKWKNWLRIVNRLCVSPKPPSSGMKYTPEELIDFINNLPLHQEQSWWEGRLFIKIVVFDHTDYEWAKDVYLRISEATDGVGFPFFLSAGNDAGQTVGNPGREDNRSIQEVRGDLLERTLWLTNRVMVDPLMSQVRVQSQQHVLLWANERGR